MQLDLDPISLRDWMAGVGLLRIVSETSAGRMVWRADGGRYVLHIEDAPEDLAARCAAWIAERKDAWEFGGLRNVNFGPDVWRDHAKAAEGVEVALWCAIGSDGVIRAKGQRKGSLQPSAVEYGNGASHQHWLASMRSFVGGAVSKADFERILSGGRDEEQGTTTCRWDPACANQEHVYLDVDPSKSGQSQRQDQTVNALASIGLAACPSAPGRNGLRTPLVVDRATLAWPVWTDPLRIADLEAALCCGSSWPTVTGRRWANDNGLTFFDRGELREPEASAV